MKWVTIKYCGTICIASITALLGGYDKLLQTMLLFTVFDMLTGLISAIYDKRLNSTICMKGIVKKIYIYFTIMIAVITESFIGGTIPLREIVLSFYLANEGISVLENLGKFITYPDKLYEIFEQLKGRVNE